MCFGDYYIRAADSELTVNLSAETISGEWNDSKMEQGNRLVQTLALGAVSPEAGAIDRAQNCTSSPYQIFVKAHLYHHISSAMASKRIDFDNLPNFLPSSNDAALSPGSTGSPRSPSPALSHSSGRAGSRQAMSAAYQSLDETRSLSGMRALQDRLEALQLHQRESSHADSGQLGVLLGKDASWRPSPTYVGATSAALRDYEDLRQTMRGSIVQDVKRVLEEKDQEITQLRKELEGYRSLETSDTYAELLTFKRAHTGEACVKMDNERTKEILARLKERRELPGVVKRMDGELNRLLDLCLANNIDLRPPGGEQVILYQEE